jgi:ATP-dependent RNA helicase RhlE
MPPAIRRFADSLLHNPEEVTLAPESPAAERIAQSVYHVDKPKKQDLLKHLIDTLAVTRAIVFTRTKHSADRVAKQLARAGTRAEAIHGNKSQNARQRTLDGFRNGKLPVLVATDIAARGIDVDDISHVFNFDIARDPESHVHRIGRTARAGAEGAAITFCDRDELPHLRAVERLINMKLEVQGDQPAPPEPGRQRGNGKPAGNKPNPSGKPRRRQPAAKNAARRGPNSANGRPNRGGQRGKRAPR